MDREKGDIGEGMWEREKGHGRGVGINGRVMQGKGKD